MRTDSRITETTKEYQTTLEAVRRARSVYDDTLFEDPLERERARRDIESLEQHLNKCVSEMNKAHFWHGWAVTPRVQQAS